MAISVATTVKNSMLDSVESAIGASAKLEIRTGAPPAADSAKSGTNLCTLSLPSDWMNAASSASKTKLGTWSGTVTTAGTAGHFSLTDSAGNQRMTGTITITSGGGDMELDNPVLEVGQSPTISTFTLNMA